MKTKIILKLRAKLPSMSNSHEYIYDAYFLHNGQYYLLNSCTWNAYAVNSKEAKEQIKSSSEFVNIIDHLLDGIIIKHNCFPAATVLTQLQAIRFGLLTTSKTGTQYKKYLGH